MAKRYCGNFPSDGYDEIGSFKAHGHDWSVWLNEKTIHQKWKSVKVCSVDPVPRKANYWLSWNGERFALNADGAAMQEHRPDIGKKVSELLEGLV